jgi:hypothetical protein
MDRADNLWETTKTIQELLKGHAMKKHLITTLLSAVVLFSAPAAHAIDRGASMIDALWFQGASYDRADYAGIRITGETQVEGTGGEWAILAGITAGELSLDAGDTYDSIGISLGVQHYLSSLTTIAILGSYTWNNSDTDLSLNTGAASAWLKQRLLSPEKPISPFIRIEASLQAIDSADSDNALVVRTTAGCDFMMGDDMAIVFEGGLSESDSLSTGGFGREDGWILNIAMQFYWE